MNTIHFEPTPEFEAKRLKHKLNYRSLWYTFMSWFLTAPDEFMDLAIKTQAQNHKRKIKNLKNQKIWNKI
jgi:uncharacterized membrane protein